MQRVPWRGLFVYLAAMSVAAPTAWAGVEICGYINCRAGEIKAGLLTGPWRQECSRSEETIRKQCLESAGASFGVCQAVCPDNAWPQESNRDKPPVNDALNEIMAMLSALPPDATPEQRRAAKLRALSILEKAGQLDKGNGAAFVARFFGTKEQLRESQTALERAAARLRDWTASGASPFSAMNQQTRRDEAARTSADLLQSLQQAEDATGLGKSVYHTVAKVIDDLTGMGADVRKYLQGGQRVDPRVEYLNRVAQGVRAVESARQLKAEDEKSARNFAEDWLRMLPSTAAPGYTGPASALAGDIVVWTRQMFETSTRGLEIVRDAMETGNVDTARVKAMEDRMNTLRTGPWSKDTFGRVVKEYVEDIPVVGKIADLLSD